MKFSGGAPRVALADSLTRGSLLKLLRGFTDGARNTPAALKLERTLSDLVNQTYGLTPAEIDLMWPTAPPWMPVWPP
jgi:hypothetical protein